MTQGPIDPDEEPAEDPPTDSSDEEPAEDPATDSSDPGPQATWGSGQATEATFPPRPAFRPSPDEIPSSAYEPTQRTNHSFVPGGDGEESIGVQGPLQPGQVLFGRYLAEKLLGEGGMGTVWLVKHLELDTQRALKLILSGIAFDPQAQARFKREARVMAKLAHPHAVVVHDARMGRDAAFIEMEFIRGQSLNRLMSQGVAMPLAWTARIVEQLCDVLDEAHRQKIVHRDLKPANLMLLEGRPAGREHLKVLDFGIAKILGSDTEVGDVHTHTGSFLGSAPYTSPEQACGTEIDGRSDIYSVGVILYELLTGHRPFTGPITRLVYDHLYTPPPAFFERNPAARVPAEVEQVVMRCLAKNPDDRPQTARALIAEFLRAIPEGYRDAEGTYPAAEPNTSAEGASLPKTLPSSWSAGYDDPSESRTRGLAEETDRAPDQGLRLPPPPLGYPPPPKPAYAPPLGPTDWGQQTYVPGKGEPPAAGRRKVVVAVAVLVGLLILGGLLALAVVRLRRPAPPPELKGYDADAAAGLDRGIPMVLVRQGDKHKTRFVRIAGGDFKMGNDFDKSAQEADDDQPAHPVALSDFYIQETEVTNAEMEAYFRAKHVAVENRPKRWREASDRILNKGQDPEKYPAVGIPRQLAEDYARSVGGRLPTEAQWEYAARSRGLPNSYVWGVEPKPDLSRANVDSVGVFGDIPTKPVGSYPRDKTAEGVLDLTGNVREWCRDVWSPYVATPEPVRDPQGPAAPTAKAGDAFVIRGGSFLVWKSEVRTTRPRRPKSSDPTANELAQDGTASDVGFRVVLEWPRR